MLTDLVTDAGAPLAARPVLSVDMLAGQLAAGSIAKYRQDWAAYQAWCTSTGAPALEAASLSQWRAHLASDTLHSPHTINRHLAAVKRIVKEGAAQGLVTTSTALQFAAVAGVKPGALRDRLK